MLTQPMWDFPGGVWALSRALFVDIASPLYTLHLRISDSTGGEETQFMPTCGPESYFLLSNFCSSSVSPFLLFFFLFRVRSKSDIFFGDGEANVFVSRFFILLIHDIRYTRSEGWSGVNWAGLISAQGAFGTDFYDRSILRPKHRAYYRSGRSIIKIGPKGALGSHEIRPIHSAPSLGHSIDSCL